MPCSDLTLLWRLRNLQLPVDQVGFIRHCDWSDRYGLGITVLITGLSSGCKGGHFHLGVAILRLCLHRRALVLEYQSSFEMEKSVCQCSVGWRTKLRRAKSSGQD